MQDLWVLALTVFTNLFSIVNPVSNVPIFLELTSAADTRTKRRVAKTSTITAFFIVTAFILLGKSIFDFLGITIPAFRITGGILLSFVGFELLSSKKSSIQNTGNSTGRFDEGVAISPLAIPMLSGPGTIVAAMNYTANQNYVGIAVIILVTAIVMTITYYAFIYSDKIYQLLGNNIITVFGKLMGLIIAIMGVNMVIVGTKDAFNLNGSPQTAVVKEVQNAGGEPQNPVSKEVSQPSHGKASEEMIEESMGSANGETVDFSKAVDSMKVDTLQ